MAKYYDYWTHGVATEIEYADRLTDRNGHGPANPRRAGWGTQIFQKEGFNWFHFALPTPTRIRSNNRIMIWKARLELDIKGAAELSQIHIREGEGNIIYSQTAHLKEGKHSLGIDVREAANRPIVISVRVDFNPEWTPGIGEVIFRGAGASFRRPKPGEPSQ